MKVRLPVEFIAQVSLQCDGPHAVAAAAAEKTKESQEPPRKRGRHANPTEGCVKVKRARFQIEPHFPETVFLKCAKDALLSVCAEKKKELGRKKDLGLKLSKEAAQVLLAVEAALAGDSLLMPIPTFCTPSASSFGQQSWP